MIYRVIGAAQIFLLTTLFTPAHTKAAPATECPITIEKFDSLQCEDKIIGTSKECTRGTIKGYKDDGSDLPLPVRLTKKTTNICASSIGGGLLRLELRPDEAEPTNPVFVYRSEVAIKMVLPQAAICDSSTTFQSGSRGSSCK